MMPDYSRIWPWIFAVLIPLMLYRRLRRNFGRQLLSPVRMTVRMTLLIIAGVLLARLALLSRDLLSWEAGGALIGLALAAWGASRTRFLSQNGRLYYVPHTYTGVAVSLLVLGRILYRFAQVSSAGLPAPGGAGDSAFGGGSMMMRSPLTLGIFYVLIGYYVCYYGWMLWKSKHITPADLETSAAPSNLKAEAAASGDTP
jgi:hypothetical protein